MNRVDMSVNFAGISFQTPIVTASGTFGFGREYGEFYDLNRLGGICVKGLTLQKRDGNPPPRIAETPMGILNSVGLQNPGVDAFLKDELPFLRQYNTRIIANISGSEAKDYSTMSEKLGTSVDLIEVNISCPNVKAGGMAFGTSCHAAAEITEAVKKYAKVPVVVKLSPNVTDITEIAKAVEAAGADAVSLINTVLGMRIDIHSRRPVLRMNTGGLSGPAVFPIAVRMVWQVANAVSIPILGMGGVSCGANAAELMLAGATLVAVGTASFQNPYAPLRVTGELEAYCMRNQISSVRDLIGAVQPW